MSNSFLSPSAPNRTLWFLGIIIGALGIIAHYYHIDRLSECNYEMVMVGFLLLVLGTTFRRM